MTANQLSYWSLQETKRSNLVDEAERARHNQVLEIETQRSNLAREGLTTKQQVLDLYKTDSGNQIRIAEALAKYTDVDSKVPIFHEVLGVANAAKNGAIFDITGNQVANSGLYGYLDSSIAKAELVGLDAKKEATDFKAANSNFTAEAAGAVSAQIANNKKRNNLTYLEWSSLPPEEQAAYTKERRSGMYKLKKG